MKTNKKRLLSAKSKKLTDKLNKEARDKGEEIYKSYFKIK